MPNHYVVTIVGYGSYDETIDGCKYDSDKFNLAESKTNLCERVRPQPPEIRDGKGEEWYQWNIDNWGTKWGTYELKAHPVCGDQNPVLITFTCAWGPPHTLVLELILDYLREEYGIEGCTVIGSNPYNCSTEVLCHREAGK